MKPLAGKVAFITGATRGIGRATAERLAADGADLALNALDASALDALATQLAADHAVRTLAIPGDVADPAAVTAAYQLLWKTWKRLDVLVNNAGVMDGAVLGMITAEHINRTLAVNTRGAILHLQSASRLMVRAKQGSIINVTSILGLRGAAGQSVYAASKAALVGLTLSAAKELAPSNIRVNAVAPGFIDTDLTKGVAPPTIALGRPGTPTDVANAIAFLASDAASYVTGQILGVDGGMVI